MNSNKTDYNTLQIYAWYVFALVNVFLCLLFVWFGLKIIFDPSAPSLSGVAVLIVVFGCALSMIVQFKKKIKELKKPQLKTAIKKP